MYRKQLDIEMIVESDMNESQLTRLRNGVLQGSSGT